jgi:hypothetical protein
MKAKTLIACAVTAAALPFAAVHAQNAEPSGPQGTGWYGAPNAAVPIPQDQASAQWQGNNPYRTQNPYRVDGQYQYRGPTGEASSGDTERGMRQRDRMGLVYRGFSADTNPPAPAP